QELRELRVSHARLCGCHRVFHAVKLQKPFTVVPDQATRARIPISRLPDRAWIDQNLVTGDPKPGCSITLVGRPPIQALCEYTRLVSVPKECDERAGQSQIDERIVLRHDIFVLVARAAVHQTCSIRYG